jgi:hypothetical protein
MSIIKKYRKTLDIILNISDIIREVKIKKKET